MTSTVLSAAALLGLPAAALADKPENPGQHGRDNATLKQQAAAERKAARADETLVQPAEADEAPAVDETTEPVAVPKRSKAVRGGKGVGFTARGVGLTALPVDADGVLTGPLELDLTSANKHARSFLGLSVAAIEDSTDLVALGEAGDAVIVRYDGLTADDALLPTDEIVVIGRARRTGRKLKTVSAPDLVRVVVVRADEVAEDAPEAPAEEPAAEV